MADRPFELRVVPEGPSEYWLALYRMPARSRNLQGKSREWQLVVRVRGTPMRAMMDHVLATIKQADASRPVFVTFAEDFSYNHGPMLSKALFDEFMAPYYRQIIPLARELGIIPIIDSDGDITAMVPWLADVGVDGFLPLERQAGVDGDTLRRKFPQLQIVGHFDKMTMPLGEEAMRAEFERLLPLMRTGGFIPSVDHQTPPGVSLETYRVYLRLLQEYTVKGAG